MIYQCNDCIAPTHKNLEFLRNLRTNKMKPTIIFDIDGTLADISHRIHHAFNKDWENFKRDFDEDIPIYPIIKMYQTLQESGKYNMIIISGRTEDTRLQTQEWLATHEIKYQVLLMRKTHDYRPDDVVKHEILTKKLLHDGHYILFAVEDRKRVVDMWRTNGLICLQCASGDF